MAGTNAAAAKAALITKIRALSGLGDLQVSYSYPGRTTDRDLVYASRISGTVALSTMRGSGRIKRIEDPVLQLHIEVVRPGEDTTETTEARACAIGAGIENYLAANPTLEDAVTGLLLVAVQGFDIESYVDDESSITTMTYQILLKSHLT
jgi:hypothetical protein